LLFWFTVSGSRIEWLLEQRDPLTEVF